jgi:hypothetical protein
VRNGKRWLGLIVWLLVAAACSGVSSEINSPAVKYSIFSKTIIYFNLDDPDQYASDTIAYADNGREAVRTMELPALTGQTKIMAHVKVASIPEDEVSVHDRWDRAGTIRVGKEGMADIEVIKLVTSYGGTDEYTVDVSHLAPALQGRCRFTAFVDTWSSPGWTVDFDLTFEEVVDTSGREIYIDYVFNPDWTYGIFYEPSYTEKDMGNTGMSFEFDVPDDMQRVLLYYLVSGHCTDGSGADEFVPKDNVIYIDDIPVYRFQPWRDDCRQFRDRNPYTRRWSSGYWSSDFSRSGWCPGDMVFPVTIDVSDHLTPGKHTVRFVIEDVRPENDNGDFGYWRISSYLTGWTKKVNVVKW